VTPHNDATGDLDGVLPVLQTPFDEDDALDLGQLEREIDFVFENGASGVVIGMVSEILRLSSQERNTLAEAVCRSTAGRGPVVVSVTAESTAVSVQHARAAEAAGASALMCALPIAGRVLKDEAMRHFERLIAATSLPLVVQDSAGYVGFELPLTTMQRLQREFDQRVRFKPETPPLGQRITELLELTGGRAKIYEGSGGIALVDAHRRGVVGTMPAADVVWAIAALWEALGASNLEQVQALRGPLTALISLQGQLDTFVAIEKHLLVVQGVISSARMRGPVGFVLDRATAKDAEGLLAELRRAVSLPLPSPT
jgi:dihydrodipicolinate synthase/N-acetylneuraminate lyase